jgi:replicative superfamily II helicase
MVDFTKRLASKKVSKETEPVALYETLDRASDKGPLRPSQQAILQEWTKFGRAQRDVIIKLHTGQGKTLVGLLMLQARLNEGNGPAVYLCPNNFLIEQTCEQAKQFGIATCRADPDLPDAFQNSEQILVTSVQKLFNGLTKFGLDRSSIAVGTLLMDDAHACADAIREACKIRLDSTEHAYHQLKTLFASELEQQGVGTYADICNGKADAMLPVPYWAWRDREPEVAAVLSSASDKKSVKFAWPLVKNVLAHCQCVVSGAALEIEPNIAPLQSFGSYWKAGHRIFMSATVTDDAFLIKGLQLQPETVLKPLMYERESWSGEKMILIPTLINPLLERTSVVTMFGPKDTRRQSGVVALATSFKNTADWAAYGAHVARTETVWTDIEGLRKGSHSQTLVLVNRYDGIDLPDDSCRILIFDGKPYSESLIDLYQEDCRPESDATLMRLVRTIEQGMGRSVRGEKDYSVIIAIGPDLTRALRDEHSRGYLSSQMATQIEIGLQIAGYAREEIQAGKEPQQAFFDLIRQCLGRDPGWKAFYTENMESVKPKGANKLLLEVYEAELEAEKMFVARDHAGAASRIQRLLDEHKFDASDRGWYLQVMARYNYPADRVEFNRLQLAAHGANRMVMVPPQGPKITKLAVISQGRVERIATWIRSHGTFEQLDIALGDVIGRLLFGVKADKFEHALDELSRALGFAGERPDKEWKEGPDNLWALDDVNYIVWECKSEVDLKRTEINKTEAEQMNRSAAWFQKHYPGCKAIHIEVHPAYQVQSAANFLVEVRVMREKELKAFVKAVRNFFRSFERLNFNDLSLPHIQNLLQEHVLDAPSLLDGSFSRKTTDIK